MIMGGRKGNLPWFSPGSAAGDDAGSQKEGWGPSPPRLVLPPWQPLNRQSESINPVQTSWLCLGVRTEFQATASSAM